MNKKTSDVPNLFINNQNNEPSQHYNNELINNKPSSNYFTNNHSLQSNPLLSLEKLVGGYSCQDTQESQAPPMDTDQLSTYSNDNSTDLESETSSENDDEEDAFRRGKIRKLNRINDLANRGFSFYYDNPDLEGREMYRCFWEHVREELEKLHDVLYTSWSEANSERLDWLEKCSLEGETNTAIHKEIQRKFGFSVDDVNDGVPNENNGEEEGFLKGIANKMDTIKLFSTLYIRRKRDNDDKNSEIFEFWCFVQSELDRLFSQITEWSDTNSERLDWLEKNSYKGSTSKEIKAAIQQAYQSRNSEISEIEYPDESIRKSKGKINKVVLKAKEGFEWCSTNPHCENLADLGGFWCFLKSEAESLEHVLHQWSDEYEERLEWLYKNAEKGEPNEEVRAEIARGIDHLRSANEERLTYSEKLDLLKLSEHKIEQFPRLFAKDMTVALEEQCHVCLERFKADTKLLILHCNHYFCEECIKEWLSKSVTCPVCRKNQLDI